MGALAFVARLQLRRRSRSLFVIAIVAGLAGGTAIALIAGSRRSATVVARYQRQSFPYDLSVGGTELTRAQMRALPMVTRADREAYLGLMHVDANGTIDGGVNGMAFDLEGLDPTFDFLAGKAPAANDPMGVFVNESFVEQYGVRVGDNVRVRTFAEADGADVSAGKYDPHGPFYTFHVTGIVRTPSDIVLDNAKTVGTSARGATNQMFVPYTWFDSVTNPPQFLQFGNGYDIKLRNQSDRAGFEAALRARDPEHNTAFQPPRFSERRDSFTTPVDFETGVLLALGIAIALAAAVVIALLLRAEQRAHSAESPVLSGLGLTRNGIGAAAALRSVPVALVAATVALGVAYAMSGWFPVGIGSKLELTPGREANAAVLAAGAASILAFLIGVAFVLGRARVTTRPAPFARSSLASWLTRRSGPTDAVVGTQLAFERGGGVGVPTRPAIAGGALALAIIAGIGVFVASIDTIYTSPPAHGWPWDAILGNTNFQLKPEEAKRMTQDARFAATSVGMYGQTSLNGQSVETLAIFPGGTAPPTVLSGRLPRTGSEVALGPKLAEQLHASIGSTVRLSLTGSEFPPQDNPPKLKDVELTVVGEALPPMFGESDLARQAVITTDAVRAAGLAPFPQIVMARFKPGARADPDALHRDYSAELALDIVPSRIVNLHQVRGLGITGALVAALLGIVLLVYTLAVGVRARTRELGILRALGMSTGRVSRVLAWQGAVIAGTIALLGMPAGVVAGIAAWRAMAHSLGVGDAATVSLALLLLIPITLALGLLASVLPARRARRNDVAALLRAE